MEQIEIFGRINGLRDQLADLERLRHMMDEWGFDTNEVWAQEEWTHNEIDRLYGLLEG